jgi:putative spermidine/putrescine transport system ATP-binding protein
LPTAKPRVTAIQPDASLQLRGVTKRFGAFTAVHPLDLTIEGGQMLALLGPSGCGKTTILRMIAGFERPTSGNILVEGKDITPLAPNQRKIGMVFQAYALFPNMNVEDNVAFGLKIAGMPTEQRRARVEEMLKLIGLSGFGKRFPFELSGGQQQRVALARALAPKPRMLLLDEPLSALDAKIRVSLRQEIRSIQRDLGITTIFVTHDQEEALSISDRIVVLNAGTVDQFGTPFDIYNKPATRFVATFVGTLNTLTATVLNSAEKTVSVDGQSFRLAALPEGATANAPLSLTMRPEAVALGKPNGQDVVLEGRIAEVSFLGSVIRLRVNLGQNALSLDTFNDTHTPPPALDQKVQVSLSSSDILILPN